MLLAVLSDIHANIHALSQVMADTKKKNVDKIVCLGDVVGLHTHPAECIDLLRSENVYCILGNHDAGVIGRLERKSFPADCWEVIEWTRSILNADQMNYLSTLPPQALVDESIWVMHGYFENVSRYMVGTMRILLAASRLKIRSIALGFYGHTHTVSAHVINGVPPFAGIHSVSPLSMRTDRKSVTLCNPGTVGQPRDADACARYLTYDSERGEVVFHRLEYAYEDVVKETLSHFPHHASFYAGFAKRGR